MGTLWQLWNLLTTIATSSTFYTSCWALGLLALSTIAYKLIRLVRDSRIKRSKIAALRQMLEVQNREVVALREALVSIREDIKVHRNRKAQEDRERQRVFENHQEREYDPEHAELEKQLEQALKRSSTRLDA